MSLADFEALWLHLLDFMDRYMHADNSEGLMEHVRELLKNMLLVMSTAGFFRPDAGSLWAATWIRIGHFLPTLQAELFPETVPAPPPPPPAPAPASVPEAEAALEASVSAPAPQDSATAPAPAPAADTVPAAVAPAPSVDEMALHPHPIIV